MGNGLSTSGARAFWEVVPRNNGPARGRWLWELDRARTEGGELIRPESEDVMNETSDDELIPCISLEGLASNSSSPLFGNNWNNS